MKNLLFFASDFSIGLSSLLSDQLKALQNAGISVTAIAGEKEQEEGLSVVLKEKKINIIRIPGLDTHHDFKRLSSEIKRLVLENKIDLIHVQNNWQLALASVVKAQLFFKRKIKIIYTLHGFRHNRPVKSQIARVVIGGSLFLLSDNVICMTEYLKSKFGFLSYKIKLLPLGVKEDYFTESFVIPPTDSLKLIFPAQFRYGKNQDLIINAFADFVKKSGDNKAILTLPGNGVLLEGMKRLAIDLGIEKQVIFPGFLSKEEIKNLYLESNISIVASNSETFGQSIVEPFVLGRCVISTPVGIAPEIIEENKTGFIFKDSEDLSALLIKLNSTKNTLISIGRNNFEKRDIFDWKNIIQRYIDYFMK